MPVEVTEQISTVTVQETTNTVTVSAVGPTGNGYIASGPYSVTDGQAATALTGELFSSATYTQIDFVARIIRGTTVFARTEFSIFYRNGAWELVTGFDRYAATAHGVTFSVHATTGQISAALDTGAGNGTISLQKAYWAA